MQQIQFNMNDYVKVKLTEKGIQILKDRHYRLKEICPSIGDFELKLDEDGYYKNQLHTIFAQFGKDVGLGRVIPFETNIILII